MYYRLAVNCPLKQYFDYKSDDKILIGCRVSVPFGQRTSIAIVVKAIDKPSCDEALVKSITATLEDTPMITPSLLSLYAWAVQYYQSAPGDVFFLSMPKALKRMTPLAQLKPKGLFRTKTPITKKISEKQESLLSLVTENAGINTALVLRAGFNQKTLTCLLEKKLIEEKTLIINQKINTLIKTKPLELTGEQKQALNIINEKDEFNPILLQGITGSGKTEVYLQAIEHYLRKNKQILVLIPEISLTPQTTTRFLKRFNAPITLLHSGLSTNERFLAWQEVISDNAKIIIGTRSALFMPIKNLGLIIIDEEHDMSFKQQDGFRYSARDLSIKYAQLLNIPIVLGSATPSLETYYNATQARYAHLLLTQRANQAMLPKIHLIDIKGLALESGLSKPLLDKIHEHLSNQHQVLLFLNRRGFSPVLMCHLCGFVYHCSECDKPYTLHVKAKELRCHRCDIKRPLPTHCDDCHSTDLLPIGLGTERLEQLLETKFNGYKVARIDRDTTSKKGSMDKFLADILANKYQILIGTQMLAKGHHFPNVTLAVIIDGDSHLFSTDFRSSERFGQLLTQVAGRAGREADLGEVVIQTRHPEHPVLQPLIKHDYIAFCNLLLKERALTKLPPFGHLALIRAQAPNAFAASNFLKTLTKINHPNITQLGPSPAPIARKKGFHQSQLLLHATHRKFLQQLLPHLMHALFKQKKPYNLTYSLDLDPQDLA